MKIEIGRKQNINAKTIFPEKVHEKMFGWMQPQTSLKELKNIRFQAKMMINKFINNRQYQEKEKSIIRRWWRICEDCGEQRGMEIHSCKPPGSTLNQLTDWKTIEISEERPIGK